MARLWRRSLLLAAVFCLVPIYLPAAVHELAAKPTAERELIVRFRDQATPAEKGRALRNSSSVQPLPMALPPGRLRAAQDKPPSVHRVQIQAGLEIDAELARLQANPAVEYVEPNYPIRLFATINAVFPNDFEFSRMYGLHNTGGPEAKENADISAPEAWHVTTGDRKVIVAVIDTGIDYFHEDLAPNLWTNAREIPANGVDDDGNGFVDDLYGYDFVSDDSDPFDDNQHGTHVAGTIGAKGNNALGTVGVCWDVSLMAVKAFDENGNGTVADAIGAISYAVANGARIINASWGLDERSKALEEAAAHAANAGVLIIAAAGNSRSEAPSYPASFETVLSVGATDARDVRALFSNYGPFVDVAAPGNEIISTLPENSYGMLSGTSMAAPHVSGMAALVLARFPAYTRQEVFDILVNSVDPMVFDQPIGNGRINLARAVHMDQPLPQARISVPATVSGVVEVSGLAMGSYFSGYSVSVGSGRTPSHWIPITSSTVPLTNGLLARFDSAIVPDGAAVVQLVVTNQNGATATANAPVRIFNGLITFPLSGDILAPTKYAVRGTIHGPGKTFSLSYGAGLNPASWVTISTGGTGLLDSPIGDWDTSALPSGYYALRLLVTQGNSTSEFLAPVIYIDHRLKPGWPVYLSSDADFPTTERRNIRPADLDGDGASEMVLVDAGTRHHPQTLLTYALDGRLLWSRVLGFDIPPDLPTIGDVDGDGRNEIFVDGTNGISAFRADGSLLPGWPVLTETANHAKVLADLDGDGNLELIAYAQEYAATQVAETRALAIYRSDGTLLRKWPLAWCGFTNDVQKIFPAVADLDGDADLEIVVPAGCSEIVTFDHDRPDPKWQTSLTGKLLSSPVIGDVDGNGSPDIVAAVCAENEGDPAGIYVWNGDGQRWSGWPVLEEFSFTTAPALGDLDRDGRLEIVLVDNSLPAALHAVQSDGFEADGWPLNLFAKTSGRVGVTIGDVNNDPYPEVLITTPGHPSLALSQRDSDYLGGITALSFSGQIIPLDAPGGHRSIPFESTGQLRLHKSAPVILGDLDGNGRLDLLLSSIQDRTFGTLSKLKERTSLYAWELDVPLKEIDWPMFGNNLENSGAYALPLHPATAPTNVTRALRDRIITGEDRELRIDPLANDWRPPADSLELVSFTTPTNGSVRSEGNFLFYLPHTNFTGLDQFTYSIRDRRGSNSSAAIIIRVKPVNDAPVAAHIDLTMRKNKSIPVYYEATDSEADDLTFRIIDPPKHGEVWNYPSVGNYYPTRGFSGTDTFRYVANDGRSDSEPARVTITILNSNNPPESVSQSLLTKTNRSVFIAPNAIDADGDPLTFELVRPPANGTAVAEENGFRFTPALNFVGEDSFTFRAHDGTIHGDEGTVSLGVIATNATPRASAGFATVQPNSTTALRLSGSDPDGDPITFVLQAQPLHGTVSGVPPRLIYEPLTNYLGPDRIEFVITDGLAQSDKATFTIEVERRNRPPESKDQIVSVPAEQAASFGLDATDSDADLVRVVLLKGPRRGLLYGAGTNLTYAPRPGARGIDSFTYKLWDGQKFGNVARVTIVISLPGDDRPPVFTSIQAGGNVVELELSVAPGKPFTVHGSTNMTEWFAIEGPVIPLNERYLLQDTNASGPFRIYRAFRN